MKQSKAALLSIMAFAMSDHYPDLGEYELSNQEQMKLNQMQRDKELSREIDRKVKKGLKSFNYNGKIIWALNKKNADRKFNRIKSHV